MCKIASHMQRYMEPWKGGLSSLNLTHSENRFNAHILTVNTESRVDAGGKPMCACGLGN